MSGSALITQYLEIAAEEDGFTVPPSFVSLNGGIHDVVRRMTRSIDPDGSAKYELEDALSFVEGLATDEDKQAIRDGFERASVVCESPIEKFLLPWLIAIPYPGFVYKPRVLFPGEGHLLEDKCVAIVPQLPIGSRRADFAIAARRGTHLKFMVVECDGAAFHDGVEQVMKDVDREVGILAHPRILEVVRFSGSQINKSARSCAEAAGEELVKCWRKDNKALAHKFAP